MVSFAEEGSVSSAGMTDGRLFIARNKAALYTLPLSEYAILHGTGNLKGHAGRKVEFFGFSAKNYRSLL